MTRGCSICSHPSRSAIDVAMTSAVPIRDIAGLYQVSRSAIGRHRAHIQQMLAIASEVRHDASVDQAVDILLQMQNYEETAIKLLNAALSRKDEVAAAVWFDRAMKATNGRLVIETARPLKGKENNPAMMRMQKQEKLAEIACRFAELIHARLPTTTIERDADRT